MTERAIRIDGFLLDLEVSARHVFPGEVTRFPVEEGPDISDHIRALPDEITLESIVSDSPIGTVATDATRADGAVPSEAALAKLRAVREARRPVVVETSLGTFEDMGLEELEVPTSKEQSGGLFFTARFVRMRLVTNRRTRVRVSTAMAGAGGGGKLKKTVTDSFQQVDDVLTWRISDAPGGRPLKYVGVVPFRRAAFDWAKVVGTRTTVSREITTDQKVSTFSAIFTALSERRLLEDVGIVYRFTGEASAGAVKRFDIAPGKRLTNEQRAWFLQDLLRDANAKRDAETRELQRDLQRDPAGTLRKMQNLPPGVDLDRFQRPPPGPTLPAGSRLPFVGGG